MGYKVVRSFYEGNTLHVDGTPFSHSDNAYVQKCLDDGNIVADNGTSTPDGFPQAAPAAEPEAPAEPTPEQLAQDVAFAENPQPVSINK